jgi:hypothetical protein
LFLSVPYAKDAAFSAYRAQLCFVGVGFGGRVFLPEKADAAART